MIKAFNLIAFLLCTAIGAGQTTYDDVAVIINDNSQVSIDIGNYFQSKRNIPSQNMIHVFAPTTEDIDSDAFYQLRVQIEDYLDENNLKDSIKYLVTTKGVPLKINSGCVIDSIPGSFCASVDSELALIVGPYSNSIGQSGQFSNPYFNSNANFDRDSMGIYLVTRLDGYSKDDVFSMIDNSGPKTPINKLSAQVIIDVNNSLNPTDSSYFRNLLSLTYDSLIMNAWNALEDYYDAQLLNQNNVFGYFSLGHGPFPGATLDYDWTKGAVSSISACASAYTFDQSTNVDNDFLIADLIEDGCTGAIGHVDYIYFSQIWAAEIFVNRYFDTTKTYNLAESYYMAEKTLSWQTVIIGDPKASIKIDNLASVNDPIYESLEVNVYPNPSTGLLNIKGNKTIESVHVVDMRGAIVERSPEAMDQLITLDLHGVQGGVYILNIKVDGELIRKRVVINK